MARKKLDERVKVVADKRTQGANPGGVAHPLKSDVDAWLAKGWHMAEVEAEAIAPAEGQMGGTPEE